MRRITAGNDAPFRWAVTLQGKPFDLTGKDVKVYVINSRGEIPVAQLTIEGHEVSGVFEGRYQTRLGEHSLVLHVNEGRPEMKTAAVANVFELVQWSADAGGSDEGDVIVAPVLIESELSIGMGGGSSYDDTEVKNELARLEREKADKSELTELSAEVSGLSEKIENLPSGESDVFKAIYGTTTYDEIKAAYDSGKVVHCDYNSYCYVLHRVTADVCSFSIIVGNNSYRLDCSKSSKWTAIPYSLEERTNKVTTISESSTDTQYPSAKAVYDAIQQSGTPSGDPMHYMFEAAGATYNATDADIPMVGVYGDSYVHKAKHWHLAEIGDLTNEEIREIYSLTNPFRRRNVLECIFAYSTIRTNFPIWDDDNIGFGSFNKSRTLMNGLAYRARGLEVFNYVSPNIPITSNTNKYNSISEVSMFLYQAKKLKKILGVLDVSYVASAIKESCFRDCSVLEELLIHSLKVSIVIKYSPMLSNASILYMIKNSAATSPIVITLHADAKARAEADAEIVAALSEKTNVTLGV